MSRETEKVLKELQRFLDSHADEIKSEDDANALAEQFLAEYDQKCAAQQDHAPETADDYLDLAEQATSKKKHMEYLRKALELEPDLSLIHISEPTRLLSIWTSRDLPCRNCWLWLSNR